MTKDRLAELREKYKNRDLLEELKYSSYINYHGYINKQNGEFINWLCDEAYRALKGADDE